MKERTGKLEAQTTDRVAYPKLRTSHVPWRRRDQQTNDDGVWNGDQLGELHVGVRQVFEDAGFAEVSRGPDSEPRIATEIPTERCCPPLAAQGSLDRLSTDHRRRATGQQPAGGGRGQWGADHDDGEIAYRHGSQVA
jgi:hypothetical protein